MKPSELLTDESKWTQGCSAKDEKGFFVSSKYRTACAWCVTGALNRCSKDFVEYNQNLKQLIAVLPGVGNISVWNDNPLRTFAEVRAKLLEAGL